LVGEVAHFGLRALLIVGDVEVILFRIHGWKMTRAME
jgi:hypothetical protein